MEKEQLDLWIMDSLLEGDYSFKELGEYFARHNVRLDLVTDSLKRLLHNKMIIISTIASDNVRKEMDISSQKESLDNFNNIVKRETAARAEHYINNSEAGRLFLSDKGVHL